MIPDNIDEEVKRIVEKRDKERANFLKYFVQLIENHSSVFIFFHVNPDGDCLGAAFGLKELILTNFPGKKAYVVGDTGDQFDWLDMKPDLNINICTDFTDALAVIVDVGNKDRVQGYVKYFEYSKTKFNAIAKVDHHGVVSDFATEISWDDPTYAATCEQIMQIADYYGWKVTPVAATYLYLGMCTDSQRFLFDSVLPRSLILAAKAWRAGAEKNLIHNKLTHRTWQSICTSSYVLNHCTKSKNIIWIHLTQKDLNKLGLEEAKGLINTFQNLEEYWIWMLFSDTPEGKVKCDFRSINVTVRELAIKYGGGGHPNASGALIANAEIIKDIVADAEEIVAKAKKALEIQRKKEEDNLLKIKKTKEIEETLLKDNLELLSDVEKFIAATPKEAWRELDELNKETAQWVNEEWEKKRVEEEEKRKLEEEEVAKLAPPPSGENALDALKRQREQQIYLENRLTLEEIYMNKTRKRLDFDKYEAVIKESLIDLITSNPKYSSDGIDFDNYLKQEKVGGEIATGIVNTLVEKIKAEAS
ncbi:phosphoesterase [Candidatus Mycoplasma haematobovis]|uniref:Phosphoesterase n=1 Tax=Candidatus Mycoplasma haematobovis TaxID=432608 RepID=A0A1A9QDQ3_9MOLU|nr:bifunctional oligoribonuclease/PAP phosphatase NrnA [Candidatus Mycoplasma haematobovis]OAL10224.1 phosphoesterase [Candidatus Mycoplasma haematobovis]